MATKVIVTGLAEDVRQEELYDLFDLYGSIVDIGVDRPTPAEVTGFVVYEDGGCAARARLGMDGMEVNGRRIAVWPVVSLADAPE